MIVMRVEHKDLVSETQLRDIELLDTRNAKITASFDVKFVYIYCFI